MSVDDLKEFVYTPEQINEQIEIRSKLLSNFVGDFYPRIVLNEIEQLKKLQKER